MEPLKTATHRSADTEHSEKRDSTYDIENVKNALGGELPDAITACVGGGSNAAGFFSGLLNDPVEIYGVEHYGIS